MTSVKLYRYATQKILCLLGPTAFQSTKEEIACGLVGDISAVRDAAEKMKRAVIESKKDVEAWNGKFPFGRADISIQCWKL